MTHGDIRNHRMETDTASGTKATVLGSGEQFTLPGSSRTESVSEHYCARCGWVEVRGVMGAFRWKVEHEDPHAPNLGGPS